MMRGDERRKKNWREINDESLVHEGMISIENNLLIKGSG